MIRYRAKARVSYTDAELVGKTGITYPAKEITVSGVATGYADAHARAVGLAAKEFRKQHLKGRKRVVVIGATIVAIGFLDMNPKQKEGAVY